MAYQARGAIQCLLCGRPAKARRLCKLHYTQHAKSGTLDKFPVLGPADVFDLRYVKKDTGCWEWTARKGHGGYGVIFFPGRKPVKSHRFAYERKFGPIPSGLVVMHSCDNPLCVNPDHLSVGTHNENVQDKIRKGRHRFGDNHHRLKITVSQVQEVRALLASGQTQRNVARRFGVDPSMISRIKTGERRAQYS